MFFDLVFRSRKLILLLSGLVIGIATIGMTELQVSPDNRIFYGPDNPYYKDYLDFESEFTTNDNILFVIAADHRITEGRFPEAIRWLTERAAGLDHVIRVDSLENYPHPTSVGEQVAVETLLDWGCPESSECKREMAEELASPHLLNRLVNRTQTATGVLATVSIERGAIGEIESLHSQAKGLAEAFRSEFPKFEVVFTGGVPMMAAFASATSADLTLLLPAALLTVSILLVFVLGSMRLAAAVIILGLASITTTLGIAGWIGHTINNATSIVPLIVFTLVVTSSMHIAVHFSRNLSARTDYETSIRQAKASLTSTTTPILISAATSAVSLCSLWFVDSPPLRQLGLMSAGGVTAGCIFTLVVLPMLLVGTPGTKSTRFTDLIQRAVNAQARKLERSKDYIAITTPVFLLCVMGLSQLQVNDDFVKFFDKGEPFRVQTDRATRLLAGPNHIEVVVANPRGTVFQPDFLRYSSELVEMLRKQPLVANAHGFSDVMEEVSLAFSGEQLSDSTSTEELAQLFLVYELSLQLGQSNTDLTNANRDAVRISVLLKETTSAEIQDLERSIYEWHQRQRPGYDLVVTGENIPVAHLSIMNIRSMTIGIFISLAFTATVLGIVFRSMRLGVVALASTVAPVLIGFGLWGWVEGEIGLAATAIIALTIGVVVDDTAHYIYRYLDARDRLQLGHWQTAAYAWHRAGAAIVSTSLVLGLGLSLLLLSNFEINSTFGAVVCLIIAAALGFLCALLPRMTVWAARPMNQFVESRA